MSEYVYKKGLYEKITLDADIPASRFKNYEYTKKDFIDTTYKDKIPLLFVDSTTKKIKLENGVLSFDNINYNISNLKIKEVLSIFEKENVTIKLLSGNDIVILLPSLFLSNFNNTTVTKINGDISPLNYKSKLLKNKTIYSIKDNITNINVVNIDKNTNEPFSESENNLFYVVGKYVRCYIKTVSTSFYIFGDMEIKQVLDGSFVANLNSKIQKELEVIIPNVY